MCTQKNFLIYNLTSGISFAYLMERKPVAESASRIVISFGLNYFFLNEVRAISKEINLLVLVEKTAKHSLRQSPLVAFRFLRLLR